MSKDEDLLKELDSVSRESKGEVRALFRAIVMSDEYLQAPLATTTN